MADARVSIMRFLGNLYLCLYLLDGTISVFDEVLGLTLSMSPLDPVRSVVAAVVLLASFPMLILVGLDTRLPRRLFLPPVLFLLWCSFYPQPFLFLLGQETAITVISFLQLFIGLQVFSEIRRLGGGLLLPAAWFTRPWFNWRRSLPYFAIGGVAVVVLGVFGAWYLLQTGVSRLSAGFIRLDGGGIHMADKQYEREGTTVRLVATMHIGRVQYYQDLFRAMHGSNTLVLVEGVTDHQGLIRLPLDYSMDAGLAGLVSQNILPFPVVDDSGGLPDAQGYREDADAGGAAAPVFLHADIDVSELSPETILFLNHVSEIQAHGGGLLDRVLENYRWSLENTPGWDEQRVFDELISRRNESLLDQLRTHQDDGYSQIIVPWGAMHMPGIERTLLSRGYRQSGATEHTVVNFHEVHWRRLLFGK